MNSTISGNSPLICNTNRKVPFLLCFCKCHSYRKSCLICSTTSFFVARLKNDGENFHVKLPVRNELIQPISVPEDLVQIQAYIRWERRGKQMYTPEQEKASQ